MSALTPRLAAVLGLLGGLCWVLSFVLDRATGGGVVDVLAWAGLALVLLAAAVGGLSLVPAAPVWLRAIAAVGAAVLVWAVVATAGGSVESRVVELVAGVLALVVSGAVIARTGRE